MNFFRTTNTLTPSQIDSIKTSISQMNQNLTMIRNQIDKYF